MRRKLIIDGNAVYEIDDECARYKEEQERMQTSQREPGRKTGEIAKKEAKQRIEGFDIVGKYSQFPNVNE